MSNQKPTKKIEITREMKETVTIKKVSESNEVPSRSNPTWVKQKYIEKLSPVRQSYFKKKDDDE